MNRPGTSWPRQGLFHGGKKQILGIKRNWRAVVANQRQEWVLWLRDYLTELAVCLIYSVQERWPPILDWRTGGRRGRGALAHTIGGHNRGNLTSDHWIG
jgi:hypothetical protein